MPDSKYKPPCEFSTHVGAACASQVRTFADLADKLGMDVTYLMRHCNGKVRHLKFWSKDWQKNWILTGIS
jgi:hypothetical protein